MANVRELRVWHVGMQLVADIQRMVTGFPRTGAGELKNQMIRAANSIPSNIAEGAGRESDPEFRRFLRIALGSCRELETQLEIARCLKVAGQQDFEVVVDRVDHEGRMLRKLIQSL